MLVTTPAVVGIISAAIAGVIAGLAAIQVSAGMGPAIGCGLVVFITGIALFIAFSIREGRRFIKRIDALVAEQQRTGQPDGRQLD